MLGKTKITTRCHLTLCGCNTSPLIRAPFFLLLYEVLLERHPSERGGWRWATALDTQRHGKSTALCGAFIGGLPMHESRRSFIKHSLRAKSTMDWKSSFTYQSQMFFNFPWHLGRNLKFNCVSLNRYFEIFSATLHFFDILVTNLHFNIFQQDWHLGCSKKDVTCGIQVVKHL